MAQTTKRDCLAVRCPDCQSSCRAEEWTNGHLVTIGHGGECRCGETVFQAISLTYHESDE